MPEPLPPAVLDAAVAGATPRQRAALALVCREWRAAVLRAAPRVDAPLRSDAGAASLAAWLGAHGGELLEVSVSTEGLFGRHCTPATRLSIFAALHAAAGSAPPAVAAGAGSDGDGDGDGSSDGEDEAPPGQLEPQAGQQSRAVRPLRLRSLRASMRIGAPECAALASLPAPALASLELTGSRTRRLGLDGVRALAEGLSQLTCLKVQHLGIGNDAAALLAQRLPRLVDVSLAGNNLGPPAAASVAQHSTALTALDLSINSTRRAARPDRAAPPRRRERGALQRGPRRARGRGAARLEALNVAGNRLSKAEPLAALLHLSSVVLSRNPLQLSAGRVLAGLPELRELVLFEALASPKGVAPLSALAAVTSLTLGADPALHPEGEAGAKLALAGARGAGKLLAGLAAGGRLGSLAAPCSGLDDGGARALGRLGGSLVHLNLGYNPISAAGLRVEQAAVLAAVAAGLRGLTYINLEEIGDVSDRAGRGGHAALWAALPDLCVLAARSYGRGGPGTSTGGAAFRSGRVMISCG
ncbi:hypothetical protein HT031_000842 [Scenedesmus sp. PABB004]|nr:hypothetical protein HT031_000842 [Scenedesmus sp. PABB004]